MNKIRPSQRVAEIIQKNYEEDCKEHPNEEFCKYGPNLGYYVDAIFEHLDELNKKKIDDEKNQKELTKEQKAFLKYLGTLNTEKIPDEFLIKIRDLPFVKSIELGEFEGCANVLVRLSEMNIDTEKRIHEMEYDLAQNFSGYVSILVLPG